MDFEFDSVKLSDKGYILVFDGKNDENLPVSQMTYDTIKGALSDISHKVSHNYGDNYTRTFLIMKSPCENNDDELDMTEDDVSEMTRWLVRKQYKVFKYIDDEGNYYPTWYKVQNTVEKVEYGDKIIGLSITVNSNAPYGFANAVTTTWSTDTLTKTIRVNSDEEGYIYPDITITVREAGELIFNNRNENRRMRVKNVSVDETITILGGDLMQISSDDETHDLAKDFNYVFPRLCVEYGSYNNLLATNLQCDVSVTYYGIRKVGL